MSPRIKKLIAALILFPSLIIYFAIAAQLGAMLPPHEIIRVPYYFLAGIAWSFPIIFLIRWANKEP